MFPSPTDGIAGGRRTDLWSEGCNERRPQRCLDPSDERLKLLCPEIVASRCHYLHKPCRLPSVRQPPRTFRITASEVPSLGAARIDPVEVTPVACGLSR